jgi:uncharacterized protein YaiE (UPF0345 family)
MRRVVFGVAILATFTFGGVALGETLGENGMWSVTRDDNECKLSASDGGATMGLWGNSEGALLYFTRGTWSFADGKRLTLKLSMDFGYGSPLEKDIEVTSAEGNMLFSVERAESYQVAAGQLRVTFPGTEKPWRFTMNDRSLITLYDECINSVKNSVSGGDPFAQ